MDRYETCVESKALSSFILTLRKKYAKNLRRSYRPVLTVFTENSMSIMQTLSRPGSDESLAQALDEKSRLIIERPRKRTSYRLGQQGGRRDA